jgi:hypothetical protein
MASERGVCVAQDKGLPYVLMMRGGAGMSLGRRARWSGLGIVAAVCVWTLHVAAAQEPTRAPDAATEQVIGAGVAVADATSIPALYEKPTDFVGKRVRVDGVVTAVCEEMGCWMAIAPAASPGQTVRLKAEHDGSLVFPISARGRPASAEGIFERIAADDAEAKDAAAEQARGAAVPDFSATYQIKASGAVIR